MDEYSLIFRDEEYDIIYHTWTRLLKKSDLWNDQERFTEGFLSKLVLKNQSAEEQISHLLLREERDVRYFDCEKNFLSIENWDILHQYLTPISAKNSVDIVLWFLSFYPQNIPQNILDQLIFPLLNNEHSSIRGRALQILYFAKDRKEIQRIIDHGWRWNQNNSELESHWGSLLLARYGDILPYSDLRDRIHPNYLGYAIECRGMREQEIKLYAQDINRIWLHLHNQLTDLPRQFPSIKITCKVSMCENILEPPSPFSLEEETNDITNTINRDASWGGINRHENTQTLEEIMSSELREENKKVLRQTVNEVITQQNEAGNFLFARICSPIALDRVIQNNPDLVKEWLSVVLSDSSEATRLFNIRHSFYKTLCDVLLKIIPEQGITLYWRLQEIERKIIIKDERSDINLLDYALFQACSSKIVEEAWKQKLERCRIDRELLEIAILAQYGNGSNWLWSVIDREIQSTANREKSRAIMLLAFMEENKALDLLNSLLANQPMTWMKELLEMSRELWNRNNWSIHWFRRFLNSNDDEISWTSFKLFLQCVDSRFWNWKQKIEQEIPDSQSFPKRYRFLEESSNDIKNKIKKNEKSLREKFLGYKILAGEIHPWMPKS